MLVKICGIKTKQAALASAKFGADFLGFNFVFSSKRKIGLKSAKEIILSLAPSRMRPGDVLSVKDSPYVPGLRMTPGMATPPLTVAVFMDQPADYINKILSQIKFDLLQFHGSETPKFCASFGLPYIKAFGVDNKTPIVDLNRLMRKYRAKYFMLDRKDRGKGAVIDLAKVKELTNRFPIILAGGLTPENIQSIVSKAGKIVGVDVAGGVEIKNKKSIKKISQFMNKTKI